MEPDYITQIATSGIAIPIFTAAPVGGVSQRQQEVCRVQVPPEQAQGWRVTLAPLQFVEASNGAITDFTSGMANKPRAIVTWGFQSITRTAVVDWPCQGGTFSVWGDNVQVQVQIPNSWIVPLGTAQVLPGAFVLPGPQASAPPTASYTTNLIAGAAAFSTVVAVPAFARSFRWHQVINLGAGNTPCPVTFYGTIDAGGTAVSQTAPSGVYTSSELTWPSDDGLTLDPSTRFITVQNNRALVGDSIMLSLEFVLDLR